MSQLSLTADVESIVLAMWGEPEEEITREVMARFDITYEHALETVKAAITAELDYDQEQAEVLISNSTEFDNWINEVVFDLANFRRGADGSSVEEAGEVATS